MNSSVWGPPLHKGLFFIAAGYDLNETPKHIKDRQYKEFFRSLGNVLPCRFCRESYLKFYEALNIDRYLQMPSCGLVRFYYDMRQLINMKLWKQEEKKLRSEFAELRQQVPMDSDEFWKKFREKAQEICYTKPPPELESVVKELYQHRAGCSAHMQTCRTPLKVANVGNNIAPPDLPTYAIPDPNLSGHLDREMYSGGKRLQRSKGSSRRRKTSRKRLTKKRKTSKRRFR